MAHEWYDATSPADTDNAGDGASEIRELKTGINATFTREHYFAHPVTPAPATPGDGIHIPKSARIYAVADRTAVAAGDKYAGLFIWETTAGQFAYWTGAAWVTITTGGGPPATPAPFTFHNYHKLLINKRSDLDLHMRVQGRILVPKYDGTDAIEIEIPDTIVTFSPWMLTPDAFDREIAFIWLFLNSSAPTIPNFRFSFQWGDMSCTDTPMIALPNTDYPFGCDYGTVIGTIFTKIQPSLGGIYWPRGFLQTNNNVILPEPVSLLPTTTGNCAWTACYLTTTPVNSTLHRLTYNNLKLRILYTNNGDTGTLPVLELRDPQGVGSSVTAIVTLRQSSSAVSDKYTYYEVTLPVKNVLELAGFEYRITGQGATNTYSIDLVGYELLL
jgi:hypothetical protein